MIGALSPLGVLIGVGIANNVSERVLQLSFAALALFMASQLVRRARSAPERDRRKADAGGPSSTLREWIR